MPISFADAVFWTGVASCAVAQVAIVRSVVRMRRDPNAAEGVPRSHFGVELAWALIPAVALIAVLAATWRTMHPPVTPPAHVSVSTEAIGGGTR